jgi:Cft2 family RNA processing exonuclease
VSLLVSSRVTLGWHNGIVVDDGNSAICFDPTSTSGIFDCIFISHAHGDHTAGFNSKLLKYSTDETATIYKTRQGEDLKNHQPLRYGEVVKINDFEVVAHDSGHMLGSTQFEVRTPEEILVYTGDVNCVETLTTNPAIPVKCDVLIIESTYGSPEFVFPEREFIYPEIARWTIKMILEEKTPVFNVYSAGKAQEVIRMLNVFTNIPVVTHPVVAKISNAYREFGVNLEFIDAASDEEDKLLKNGNCVYVAPTTAASDFLEKSAKATVTGWAVKFTPRKFDAAFPLSSHADFKQLVEYVMRVKPRKVYSCFGFDAEFSEYLRKRVGVRAQPLQPISQRSLRGFL